MTEDAGEIAQLKAWVDELQTTLRGELLRAHKEIARKDEALRAIAEVGEKGPRGIPLYTGESHARCIWLAREALAPAKEE